MNRLLALDDSGILPDNCISVYEMYRWERLGFSKHPLTPTHLPNCMNDMVPFDRCPCSLGR